jgi:hypothetical protein
MSPRPTTPTTKRGTAATQRLRKCLCLRCGFLLYITRKWLQVGFPVCGNDNCSAYLQPLQVDCPAYLVARVSERAAYSVAKAWSVPRQHVRALSRLRDELNAPEARRRARGAR